MITKRKSFNISARIFVETDIAIKASSLKEAIELSEELTFRDFVELKNPQGHIDSGCHVTGVFEEISK